MKATIELTKKTALEEIINSNDIDTIKSLIERKEMSLKEAHITSLRQTCFWQSAKRCTKKVKKF